MGGVVKYISSALNNASYGVIGDLTGENAAKEAKKQSKAQQAVIDEQKKLEAEKRKTLIQQQRSQIGVGGDKFSTSSTGATGIQGKINQLG